MSSEVVTAVWRSPEYTLQKPCEDQIRLLAGLGVEGDAHMGENGTTSGIDLLGLPRGAVLCIGPDVRVEVTGLRNPCSQLDSIHEGLMAAMLDRDENGELIRKAGVMSVVLEGGMVRAGDAIVVQLPPEPHQFLERV